MKVLTISTLRTRIKYYFDSVINSSDILIIPRNNSEEDHDAIVIMSLKEYNSLQETNYLLLTEANRDRLLESIEQSKKGQIREVNIEKY